MLVFISDLHLSDGTSGETISAGAFRIFRHRLSDMAYDASWRANGHYKPIEQLDIVLLGDIFDLIRSTKWVFDENGQPNMVRPWDDFTGEPFINTVNAIHTATLQHNAKAAAVLRSLSQERAVTIPPATPEAKPASVSREPDDPNRHPVKISLHYMVGNHDWFYYLPGTAFNQMRQEVVESIGLANSPLSPFPHDANESPELANLFAAHNVSARHGDIHDTDNYEEEYGRNASSLGDAVVVELLNRFPSEVKSRMGEALPQATEKGLRELDNVRPMLVVPLWINSLLSRTCTNPDQIKDIKRIWDDLADDFLNHPFVRARDRALDFFDGVDKLEWALKFSRGVSMQTLSQLVTWLKEKTGGKEVTYHHYAFNEPAFQNKTARFIVNGHTHVREIVPLDSTIVMGSERLDQMYMNCGTWRRVHELARVNPQEQEFMGYHEMTYFAFYKDGERKGRPFEMWGGTLGVG
jgi:UDP-2,3-diacylglucosamine pyrophosphatase LpxH